MSTFLRRSLPGLLVAMFSGGLSAVAQTPPDSLAAASAMTPDPALVLTVEPNLICPDSLATPAVVLADLRIARPTPHTPGVLLYWATSRELPCGGFAIERRDGEQGPFRRVAVVPAQGNPQEKHFYAYADEDNTNPRAGYYRLRQLVTGEGSSAVSVPQSVIGFVPGQPGDADIPEPIVMANK